MWGETMNVIEQGIKLFQCSEYEKIIKMFDECIKNKNYNGKKELYIMNYYIADSYKIVSNYIQAISFFKICFSIADELEDNYKKFDCLYSIVSIYCIIKDFKSASINSKRAVELAKLINEDKYISKAYNLQGAIYLDSTDDDEDSIEKGIERFKKGLEYSNDDDLIRERITLMANIGEANNKLGKYEEALPYLYKALEIYSHIDDNYVHGFLNLNISKSYKGICRYEDAKDKANLALEYFQKSKDRFYSAMCYEVLADIYRMQGDLAKALDYYMFYSEIMIEIKNKEYIKVVCKMREEYDLLRIEKDNEIFKLRNEELAEANKKLKEAYEEVNRISMRDYLTDIYNRRGLFEKIKEIETDKTNGIILIDIDYFKNINDKYGHDVGDKVLQYIVSKINSIKKEEYLVARWGGEEFIIILPGENIDEAFNFAENLASIINNKPFYIMGKEINISFTSGVDEFKTFNDIDNVISSVDAKLYKGKENGRSINIK